MQLYIAEVINNNDLEMKGRVQIYCAPIHHNIKIKAANLLPWAQSASCFTSMIPEKNSYVWVYFEKEEHFKNPFYIAPVNFSGLHGHNKTIGSMTAVYPNVKYIRLPNDVAIALSSDVAKPEISIHHPKAEIYMDTLGNATLYFTNNTNKIDITSNGIKITDKNSNEVTCSNTGILIEDKNGNTITCDAAGIKLSGGLVFEVTGTPNAPNGLGGFCALPGGTCLFTGATITTNKITGI